MSSTIQSVRFKKSKYTYDEAKEAAKNMGFKTSVKPNPQYKNWHAFRQIQPSKFDKNSFYMINHPKTKDIEYVMGHLK